MIIVLILLFILVGNYYIKIGLLSFAVFCIVEILIRFIRVLGRVLSSNDLSIKCVALKWGNS